jgi:hypothetical protein
MSGQNSFSQGAEQDAPLATSRAPQTRLYPLRVFVQDYRCVARHVLRACTALMLL